MTANNDMLDQPFVTFLRHLRTEKGSMKVRRDGAAPKWSDEQMHVAAFERNPEVYALMAVKEAQSWQRARILFQLLRSSRSALSPSARHTLERAAKILLAILHPDQVFTVFLALRRCRANHKHTSRNILDYILNHPCLEDMALKHRPILVDCLEHALGKNVARACAKLLLEGKSGDRYLRRSLLRFARNKERVEKVVPFLFGKGQAPAAGQSYPSQLEFEAQLKGTERPATVTATNRGDIAATLVHIYRGGQSPDLVAALERYVADAAAKLPRFDGKMALVLDASASTRGYGEREFCCISQSVALMMVLKKCCSHLSIFQVGGTILANPPAAEGPTDLAIALLDALATDSDLVAVVSDGYENLFDGDFRKVVASLKPSGVKTPVVFCHSKFTWMDDLTMRRPALLPELEFWHQAEFEDVIISLIATANGAERDKCLRNFLLHKLEEMETKFSADANDHSKLFPAAVQEGR